MSAASSSPAVGWRAYGLALIGLAVVCLAWGDFEPGQAVPKSVPDRAVLAYAVAAFMLVAGAAIQWRRTTAWAAAALAGYFGLVVVAILNGRVILAHPTQYVAYSGAAEQLAIAAAGLIVYAANAKIDSARAARITRIGELAFGICALLFGGAHFVYLNFTAPLVPKWLPPSQLFWAYATGVAHIAAGLAVLTGVRARLAAVLLTLMYASFTPLVHIPSILAAPSDFTTWTENGLNLALAGAAWVVADSFSGKRDNEGRVGLFRDARAAG